MFTFDFSPGLRGLGLAVVFSARSFAAEDPTGFAKVVQPFVKEHCAHDPDKHPPLANVLLTVAQKTGAETEKFSDATGAMSELV